MNYSNQVQIYRGKKINDRMFCSTGKKQNNNLETWETYLNKSVKIKSKSVKHPWKNKKQKNCCNIM